jgi:Domain of unknown function (DUF4198)
MKRLILAALLLAAAAPAWAYTAYLKPDRFWPEGDGVTIEAAYANTFFTPEIALPAQIAMLHPDGRPGSFLNTAVGAAATTLFANLPRGGTYRFSTGEQLGPVTTLVGDSAVPGGWRQLAAGEAPPPDAITTTLQTVTLADVYVTRGTPTRTVVDAANGHLVLRPVTHPNQVLAASGFEVDVLFDGAPMANTALVLYAAGDSDTRLDRFVTTDAQGRARFSFDAPGQYLIAARHRANAPAGSAAAVRSYTTTLTLEALAALPATFVVPERNAEPERRSRRRRDR